MTRHDLKNRLKVNQSIKAQEVGGTLNGAGVDCKEYGGVLAVVDVGTATGTTPTCTIRLEESADGTNYTAVAAADLIGGLFPGLTGSNDEQVHERSYLGAKRHLRFAVTAVGGTTPVFPLSAFIVGGNSRTEPTA